ncbi:MAG: hypothetical protein V1659_04725 [Candidatus Woesearchaeota archaeon]
MISIHKAEQYVGEIKPCLAGFVSDSCVSDKAVLATLLDLNLRGYLSIDVVLKDWDYKINRVSFLKKDSRLSDFENEFLGILFAEAKILSSDKLSRIMESSELHNAIKKYIKNIYRKKADSLGVNHEPLFRTGAHPSDVLAAAKTSKESRTSYSVLAGFCIFVAFFFAFRLMGFASTAGLLVSLALGVSALALVYSYYANLFRKEFPEMEIHIETLKPLKKKTDELYVFLQRHKFESSRARNRFMPYAFAFGLSSWEEWSL